MRFKILLILAAGLPAVAADAGVFTDDLSRCLVEAASPTDRVTLMKWMFAAYAASDAAQGIATMTPAQHTAFNRQGAELFRRLLLKDCRKQAANAIRNEGASSIERSFETLGQIAGRGIMSDPKVAAQMEEFASMVDPAELADLSKEAGAVPK